MEKIITVEDATVNTATIQIKTLMIGKRQVTLAVFRQIIEESLIDGDTCELRGSPWGLVNYHSGVGCDQIKNGEHIHVVWQKGNELRRSCVQKLTRHFQPDELGDLEHWRDNQAHAWACLALLDGWLPANYEKLHNYSSNNWFLLDVDGSHIEVHVSEYMNNVMHARDRNTSDQWLEKYREELRKEARTFGGGDMTKDELLEKVRETAAEAREYRDKYHQAYASIAGLDQLFIAV